MLNLCKIWIKKNPKSRKRFRKRFRVENFMILLVFRQKIITL